MAAAQIVVTTSRHVDNMLNERRERKKVVFGQKGESFSVLATEESHKRHPFEAGTEREHGVEEELLQCGEVAGTLSVLFEELEHDHRAIRSSALTRK